MTTRSAQIDGELQRGSFKRRHTEAYLWLGAGAFTLGLGAALASGSGVAHADTGTGSTHDGSASNTTHRGEPASRLKDSVTSASRAREHGPAARGASPIKVANSVASLALSATRSTTAVSIEISAVDLSLAGTMQDAMVAVAHSAAAVRNLKAAAVEAAPAVQSVDMAPAPTAAAWKPLWATNPVQGTTVTCQSSGFACTGGGYGSGGAGWADKYFGKNWTAGGSPVHNCTRYAAYRLSKLGVKDPNKSWGNAAAWDANAPGTHNATPTVGSIAWWPANSSGNYKNSPAGPAGHVGYVTQVVKNPNGTVKYIVVESDNFGTYNGNIIGTNTFKIMAPTATAPSPWWPRKFLHIAKGT